MQATALKVDNQAHWHQLRASHVGASEVAALFGVSPYQSRFTLWHMKAGQLATPDLDSERMRWGQLLEPIIAQGIAEVQDWTIRKVHRYLQHPTIKGMGASLDFEIVNHDKGVGCFEIKNVDRSVFSQQWAKAEDGTLEAPLHIELQLQHQLAVTGRAWGAIGLLVGGNTAHVVIRERHPETIAKIEQAVASFWESIAQDDAPAVTSGDDLDTCVAIFKGEGVANIDNPDFEITCQYYQQATKQRKEATEAHDTAKAKVIALLHETQAEVGTGGGFKASYKLQSRPEHVVKASEFRVLRVTELKKDSK